MTTRQKPVKVKKGSVEVRIYRREKDGRVYYQIADYSSGKRRFKNCTDLAEAKREAISIAEKLSRGEAAALELTNEDRSVYVRSLSNLKPTGITLDVATQNYAEACKILGGDWIIEAAKFYKKRNLTKIPTKTITEVVEEFIAAKEALQKDSDTGRGLSERYVRDLRSRCRKFSEYFQCNIASVSTGQVEDFLHGMRLSARSFINYRRVLNTLFEYAKRRGYLPKDHDTMEQVEKLKDPGGDIEIYTPSEMKRLLAAADQDYLPCLVIGGFAGLRSSELERLEWSDINLEDRFIEIKRGKTKTKTRRIVPITDNLAKWLEPYANYEGKVWPHLSDALYRAQKETAARTENKRKKLPALKWKTNGLRHSFISYRLAAIQNANQVALESGNSVTVIFAHYRELVRPKGAEEWFSLVPSKRRVIPFEPIKPENKIKASVSH